MIQDRIALLEARVGSLRDSAAILYFEAITHPAPGTLMAYERTKKDLQSAMSDLESAKHYFELSQK